MDLFEIKKSFPSIDNKIFLDKFCVATPVDWWRFLIQDAQRTRDVTRIDMLTRKETRYVRDSFEDSVVVSEEGFLSNPRYVSSQIKRNGVLIGLAIGLRDLNLYKNY